MYATHVSTRSTPQSQKIPGSSQVPNSAGGFTWQVDCWTRLDRFLILGNEGGSYYAGELDMTIEASEALAECVAEDPKRTVDRIVEISVSGRAPKNAPAVFALAQLSKDHASLVEEALQKVCRTGTDLFAFYAQARAFRGGGRSLRRMVGRWYTDKKPDDLAYQLAKYQQRNGWSHRDVLSMVRPKINSPVIRWAMGMTGETREVKRCRPNREVIRTDVYGATDDELPRIIRGMELAKLATSAAEVARIIREYRLVRECVPTERMNSPEVWEAMLDEMPLMAMIRNLGKMSSVGLLKPLSDASRLVCDRLGDVERLRKARVHPLAVLLAMTTYGAGRGIKGSLAWQPVPQVTDALNDAFYQAFSAIEPTGKRWMLGVDVSGSMSSPVSGTHISCAQAAACLTMVTLRTEPQCYVHGFADRFVDLGFSKSMRLDQVCGVTERMNFGATDCALPMIYALKNRISVDAFVVLTDSETWYGHVHPAHALRAYRDKMGIDAKLIVLAMVSNKRTIADPNDRGMLDVVGLDTSVPQVMSQFVAG